MVVFVLPNYPHLPCSAGAWALSYHAVCGGCVRILDLQAYSDYGPTVID